MNDLPSGTVTLLFTDIEGSTRLLREHGSLYGEILDEHARILRTAFAEHDGREIDTQGDSFFAAFRTAQSAVDAAVAAQRALAAHSWPNGAAPKVRMGLHTGEPVVAGERYVGLAVHRAARICAAGHGCQVLLSSATGNLIADTLPPALAVDDLGEHRLKDFDRPERVFQLVADDLPSSFPPLRTLESAELPATAGDDRARRLPAVLAGRTVWLLLAVVLLVLVPLVATIAGRDGASTVAVPSRSVAVIDPGTNAVSRAVELGASPEALISFDGAVWAASPGDRTLARIDPDTHAVTDRAGLTVAPHALAAGHGALWVGGGAYGDIVQVVSQAGDVDERTALESPVSGYPVLSVGGGDLWFGGNDDGGVHRFDPDRGRIVQSIARLATPEAIAAADDAVWVVERFDQEVTGFDPVTGVVLKHVPLGTPIPLRGASTIREPLSSALLYDGRLWVTDALEGKVWRIRPAEGSIEDTIPVGAGALSIAGGEGSIWVANRAAGSVSRIDPRTGEVAETIEVADRVSGIAVAGGSVWVAVP